MLRQDELQHLEKEFIQFLVINGIAPQDWEQIKKNNQNETELWLSKFSDVVIEKSLLNIVYLEFRTPNQLFFFKCNEATIELVVVNSNTNNLMELASIDFTNDSIVKQLLIQYQSKQYKPNRTIEVFGMTESGALITDGKIFETLKLQAI